MSSTIEDGLILGDVSALKDMYLQYGPFVQAIAGVVDPDSQDRVAASVFISAWEQRRDFDPSRGSVRAWIVRLIRRMFPLGEESDQRVDEIVIAGAVAAMDDSQREILVEGSAANGQVEDLAARLNLPVGTVESNLRRGVKILRSELVESRDDRDDSRLAAIISSGRIEADFGPPSDDVWRQIAEDTGVDGALPLAVSRPVVAGQHDQRAPEQTEDLTWRELDAHEVADEAPDSVNDDPVDNADGEIVDEATDDVIEDVGDDLGEERERIDAADLLEEFETVDEVVDSAGASDIDDGVEADGDGEVEAYRSADEEPTPEIGLVDEFSTTEFPGQEPIQPDLSGGDDAEVPYVLSGQYRPGVDKDPYDGQMADSGGDSGQGDTDPADDADDSTSTAAEPSSPSDTTLMDDIASILAPGAPTEAASSARPARAKTPARQRLSDSGDDDGGSSWVRFGLVALAAVVLLAIFWLSR